MTLKVWFNNTSKIVLFPVLILFTKPIEYKIRKTDTKYGKKIALEIIYANLENLWLLFLTKRIFVKLVLTVKIGIKYSF